MLILQNLEGGEKAQHLFLYRPGGKLKQVKK
jgi:hypothetical protein